MRQPPVNEDSFNRFCATLGEGDGRWVTELSLAFLLIFLRDNAPLLILALVILKAVSALSISFAIVWRVEHLTSAFYHRTLPSFHLNWRQQVQSLGPSSVRDHSPALSCSIEANIFLLSVPKWRPKPLMKEGLMDRSMAYLQSGCHGFH